MKIYNDIEQRTDEWYNLRKLHLTGSNAHTILANGKGLETYIDDVISEYLSGEQKELIINADIQRGIDLEPVARLKLCDVTGLEFQEVGAVELDERCLVSPDGVIFDKDGKIKAICELKCPNAKNFINQIINDEIPKNYIAQMQMQLLVTGAEKCFYFAFNPNVKPYYYMREVIKDDEIQEKLLKGIERGKELIEEKLLKYFEAIERELRQNETKM